MGQVGRTAIGRDDVRTSEARIFTVTKNNRKMMEEGSELGGEAYRGDQKVRRWQ